MIPIVFLLDSIKDMEGCYSFVIGNKLIVVLKLLMMHLPKEKHKLLVTKL